MATKSALTTTLNGFISALVGITKHRNANNAIVNEFYPTVLTDTQATETYATKTTGISYAIWITKQGRKVTINGECVNTSGSAIINPTLFVMKTGDLYPAVENAYFTAIDIDAPLGIPAYFNQSGVHLLGTFDDAATIGFTITYNVLA